MPVPPEHIIKEMEKEMARLMNLPPDWKVKIEVKPFLMYDMGYEIDKENKTVYIKVYSARYPMSYEEWKRDLANEVMEKMGWKYEGKVYRIIDLETGDEIESVVATSPKQALAKYMREGDEIAFIWTTIGGKRRKLYILENFEYKPTAHGVRIKSRGRSRYACYEVK